MAELDQWKKSRAQDGAFPSLVGKVPEEDELNDDKPEEDDAVLEEMVRREEKMLEQLESIEKN